MAGARAGLNVPSPVARGTPPWVEVWGNVQVRRLEEDWEQVAAEQLAVPHEVQT